LSRVLSVSDLSFSYGGDPVFSQISFSARRGDFIVVIGANGSGKSTLFRLILGELVPSGGEIRLFEDDTGSPGRPSIGCLSQNGPPANTDFPATVEEIVRTSLFSLTGLLRPTRRKHREKAHEALEQVGMAEYAKRRIGDLSGGQRQRVMLARVLAGDPELLMLDEPTSGVDLPSMHLMFELLSNLNRTGVTILMITHNIDRALEYASRVLCLENGSLVELEKKQILEELSHKHKQPVQNFPLREEAEHHGAF
jgi:zinc transport system ATP-binding protein